VAGAHVAAAFCWWKFVSDLVEAKRATSAPFLCRIVVIRIWLTGAVHFVVVTTFTVPGTCLDRWGLAMDTVQRIVDPITTEPLDVVAGGDGEDVNDDVEAPGLSVGGGAV
jgi:hypothetical protein